MSAPEKKSLANSVNLDDNAEAQQDQQQTPHPTAADNAHREQASREAENAQADTRERMVDIGRGNQQAGRQGQ
jgi:hypothetical protein